MNNEKMGNIIETAGIILGMSLFTIASLYLFPLLLLVFPVMFIILGIKNGMLEGIISLMTTCTIVAYLIDPMTALYLFIVFAPITMTIIYTTKSRKRTMDVLLYASIALFTSMLILFYLINLKDGNLIGQIEEYFRETIQIRIQNLKDLGLSSYEILEDKNFLENIYKDMLLKAPSSLLLSTFVISYINYSLSIKGLKRVGINIVNIPRFALFRLPNNITIGVIVMFVGALIAKMLGFAYFEAIVENVTVLVGFMFLIQGLSIIDFFLIKIKVKTIFRFIFISLTVLITPLVSVVSMLGLIDVMFDFRKLRRKESL